jgi:hypothetical protein
LGTRAWPPTEQRDRQGFRHVYENFPVDQA